MKCQSCEKQKDKLNVVRSKVVKSLDLKLCSSCKFEGYEPRWTIILGARSQLNLDVVGELVSKRLYLGEEIRLVEVLA